MSRTKLSQNSINAGAINANTMFAADVVSPHAIANTSTYSVSELLVGKTILLDNTGNIQINNGGTIGSTGDADSMTIATGGVVTFSQIPVMSAGLNVSGGTIAGTLATAAQGNITSLGALSALDVNGHTTVDVNGEAMYVTTSGAGTNALRVIGSDANYTGNIVQPWSVRAASTAFDFIECVSSNGSAVPFRVRGDGQVTSSGGATFTGSVGLGTTSPVSVLTSEGDISISSTVTSDNGDLGEINFWNRTNAGSGSGTSFVNDVAAIQGQMVGTGNNSGGDLHFYTKADGESKTEAMIIDGDQNVGIGIAAPLAKLHVSGTHTNLDSEIKWSGDGQVSGYLGSQGSIASFGSDHASSGFNWKSGVSAGSGTGASGTERMTLIATNGVGKLGIGTSAPLSALHVAGGIDGSPATAGFHAGMSGNYAAAEFSGTDGGFIDFQDATDGSDHDGRIIYTHSTNAMIFSTAGSQRFHILGDGKVAINKTSSTEFLEVHGAIGSSHSAANFGAGDARANLDFATGAGGTRVGSVNGNYGLVFLANSGEKGRFSTSGEFSVGSTSTTGMIDVTASSWSKNAIYVRAAATGGGQADFAGIGFYNTADAGNIYVDESHNMSMTTDANIDFKIGSTGISGGTSKLRIASNGSIGMHQTSPGTSVLNASGNHVTGVYFDVQPGTGAPGGIVVGQTGRASNTSVNYQGYFLRRNDGWNTSTSGMFNCSETTGGDFDYWEKMIINNDGGGATINMCTNMNVRMEITPGTVRAMQVLSGGTVFFDHGISSTAIYNNTTSAGADLVVESGGTFKRSTSSRRYKNTIQDATHGLAELLTLRARTFKHREDGDKVYGGLIAEEVHDAGLTEFVGYDTINKPMSVNYGNMVALCIKSIQEQQTKIDALEARIATLEGQLNGVYRE